MLPIFARRHCKYRQQSDSGQRVSRVYDLGCSLGAASMTLAGEFDPQDLQIKAIDISPAMTTEATTLLSENYPKHDIEVITADIRDIELEPCDMVILNLTLQFLPAADRVAVLEKIYAALSEGGILVLTEKKPMRLMSNMMRGWWSVITTSNVPMVIPRWKSVASVMR